MKQKVTAVKDLHLIFADLEVWIKNPEILYSGRAGNMQLLPREILANWLICILGSEIDPSKSLTFSNDPFGGGDGIIIDRNSEEQMVTEHVFVPKHKKTDESVAEELVIKAIQDKQAKGKQYAEGKHLIVFCDGIGNWFPNKVGREIEGKHDFASVWAIGLETPNDNFYTYWIVELNKNHSPAFLIRVNFKEKNWCVSRIQ
jgi:hypothetical protein